MTWTPVVASNEANEELSECQQLAVSEIPERPVFTCANSSNGSSSRHSPAATNSRLVRKAFSLRRVHRRRVVIKVDARWGGVDPSPASASAMT
jgi:hypothetical protein